MKIVGELLFCVALVALFYSFGMDVTSPGTNIVNNQRLAVQGMAVNMSGVLFVSSILLIGFGKTVEQLSQLSMSEEERKEHRASTSKSQKGNITAIAVLVVIVIAFLVFR